MIVYRDIISGDEMLSDAFKLEEVIDSEGNKVCPVCCRVAFCNWF